MSNELFNRINKILAQWNPLDVPEDLSEVEYKDYVNRIISSANSYEDLKNELMRILHDDLGLEYSVGNELINSELNLIVNEILRIRNSF